MKRTVSWVLTTAAVGLAGAGCDLVLGLNQYKNCPQDLGCPEPDAGPLVCAMNGTRDGDETDVDCGGGLCPACADGKGCSSGADCASKVCVGGACQALACDDGVKNGDETDRDCGGICGATCKAGAVCGVDGDCKGGICSGGICAPTCTDGEKSGDETGMDCGGVVCPACPDGEGCAVSGDCGSGVCRGGTCESFTFGVRCLAPRA